MWFKLSFVTFLYLINSSVQDDFLIDDCPIDRSGYLRCRHKNFRDSQEVTIVADKTSNATSFNCNQCKLPKIPNDIFANMPNLTQIVLSVGIIAEVHQSNFEGGENLLKLFLSSNKIEKLENNVFRNLINLEYLSLTENNLSELQVNCFSGLIRLENLDLSKNKFKSLPAHIFSPLSLLVIINLNENELLTIRESIFRQNLKLKQIDFEDSKITEIDANTFKYHQEIDEIWLSKNNFEEIHFGSVKILHINNGGVKRIIIEGTIEKIYAYENDIEEIRIDDKSYTNSIMIGGSVNLDWNFLQDANNLKTLILRNRSLRINHAGIFSDLVNLETLEISDSELGSFPAGLFENLVNLKYLVLKNNKLTEFDINEISSLMKLRKLDFEFNELSYLNFVDLIRNHKELNSLSLHRNRFRCSFLNDVQVHVQIYAKYKFVVGKIGCVYD